RADREGRRSAGRHLVEGHQLTTATAPSRTGRGLALGRYVALLPFFGFLTVFLVVPTVTVVIGAFQTGDGGFTWGNMEALGSESARSALKNSLVLSASTAVIGAVLGAVLAYLVISLGEE